MPTQVPPIPTFGRYRNQNQNQNQMSVTAGHFLMSSSHVKIDDRWGDMKLSDRLSSVFVFSHFKILVAALFVFSRSQKTKYRSSREFEVDGAE